MDAILYNKISMKNIYQQQLLKVIEQYVRLNDEEVAALLSIFEQ